MDSETGMETLRIAYELTDAAYGLLPAFKEILNWSRLYGEARLQCRLKPDCSET